MKPLKTLLVSIFCIVFNNFASAKCLPNSDLAPECRYESGDSWCAEQGNAKNRYAYSDSCLQQRNNVKSGKKQDQLQDASSSAYIRVFGININMPKTQVYHELERRGHPCTEKTESVSDERINKLADEMNESFFKMTDEMRKKTGSTYILYPDTETVHTLCENSENPYLSLIRILFDKDDRLVWALFGCSVFNTCENSLRDASQLLINSTTVKSLSISNVSVVRGIVAGSASVEQTQGLCGFGPVQDRVCIFDNKDVRIDRANYGSRTPSYK